MKTEFFVVQTRSLGSDEEWREVCTYEEQFGWTDESAKADMEQMPERDEYHHGHKPYEYRLLKREITDTVIS